MNIHLSKIEVTHEDERRRLVAIFNGDFTANQVKVSVIKRPSVLGRHYHYYSELFYIFDGQITYTLVDVKTGHREIVKLGKGDRLVIGPEIAHKAEADEGTILIEATEEPYRSAELNDMRYEFD